MEQTETIERRYWSIGEVARSLSIAPSRIRFWLAYLGMDVKTRRVNKRFFTRPDINLLSDIKHLVDNEGFTLWGMRRKLESMGYIKPSKATC